MTCGAAIALLFLAGPAAAIEPRVEVVERDGRWSFRVDVRTDLPDDALLRIVIRYVTRRRGVDGEPIEETVTLHQDRTHPLETHVRTRGGAASAHLGTFGRRPPPIVYRATVEPEGDGPPAQADTPEPSADEISCYERDSTAAARDDLLRVRDLFTQLRDQYSMLAGLDRATELWSAFASAFRGRVDDLSRRNDERFEVWAFWAEARGKQALLGLADRLTRLVDAAARALADASATEESQQAMNDFLAVYAHELEEVGIEEPFDPESVAEQVASLDAVIVEILAAPAESWAAARDARLPAWESASFALLSGLPDTMKPLLATPVGAFQSLDAALRRGDDPAEPRRSLDEAWRAFREALGAPRP